MLLLALTALAAAGPAWKVDPDRSRAVATVHLVDSILAKATGTLNHALEVPLVGTMRVEPGRLSQVDVSATVASLVADSDEARKRVDLDDSLPDRARGWTESCVLANLDAVAHPSFHFVASDIAIGPDGTFQLVGDLTVQGHTARVSGTGRAKVEGDRMVASGGVVLGVRNHFPELPSSWAVDGDIRVTIDLVAVR